MCRWSQLKISMEPTGLMFCCLTLSMAMPVINIVCIYLQPAQLILATSEVTGLLWLVVTNKPHPFELFQLQSWKKTKPKTHLVDFKAFQTAPTVVHKYRNSIFRVCFNKHTLSELWPTWNAVLTSMVQLFWIILNTLAYVCVHTTAAVHILSLRRE